MKYFLISFASLVFASSLTAQTPNKIPAQIPMGYKLETVPLPRGAVTILGICHKPDGTLAAASWEGEVWEYKNGSWSLFATGLMEPNGIYYDEKDDAYYVAQKPELTRLVDTDKDGKCDRYECVTDEFGASGEYHEYHYGPVVDSLGRKYASLNLGARGDFIVPDGKKGVAGNMSYNAPWRGWVYRSDRMGHFQPLASGLRSPCGIGVSPKDELFVTDNQGDWVADSCLYHIREGNFYGHPASLPARPDFTKEKVLSMTAADFDKIRTLPAIWFPREVICNSPGSPVWDTTGGKFGPFQGQMFIGDQTQSNYFRCGLEEVDGELQGWCVDFIRGTASGTVKMSFDAEGRLWSAQVGRGWLSKGGKRSALQYAKWDNQTQPFEIHNAALTKTGFKITFTDRIGKKTTPKVSSWHYKYHSVYGSPKVDETELPVTNYTLSPDRRTVTFDVPLTTGKVYALNFQEQKNTDSAQLGHNTVYYTLNKTHPEKQTRKRTYDPKRGVSSGLLGGWRRNDNRRPIPTVVEPLPAEQTYLPAPGDATQLDASQWTNTSWQFDDNGVMPRGKGNNLTKEAYGSSRIHLEFMFDEHDDPEWQGQLYGNSGIFPMSHYELQVVNTYQNPTVADGQCGALYGQRPPRVNACRAPGEWQSYDILYKAPTFNDNGSLADPLRISVFHNGVLIHNDASFLARITTLYQEHGKLPLKIQDHKGSKVSFRNLWIVPDINYDTELEPFLSIYSMN